MEKIKLLQEKKDLLLKAIHRLDSLGETLEERLDGISDNEQVFYDLKKLQIKIQGKNTQYPSRQQAIEKEILDLMETLQQKMVEIQSMIKRERIEAQNALAELNKSKKIAGGYVHVNQGPVFVDKDFV